MFIVIIQLHCEVVVDDYIQHLNITTTAAVMVKLDDVCTSSPNNSTLTIMNYPLVSDRAIDNNDDDDDDDDDDIHDDDHTNTDHHLHQLKLQDNSIRIPPIYILNLDRAHDRWIKSQQSMKKTGLHAIRFPAVGMYIYVYTVR